MKGFPHITDTGRSPPVLPVPSFLCRYTGHFCAVELLSCSNSFFESTLTASKSSKRNSFGSPDCIIPHILWQYSPFLSTQNRSSFCKSICPELPTELFLYTTSACLSSCSISPSFQTMGYTDASTTSRSP